MKEIQMQTLTNLQIHIRTNHQLDTIYPMQINPSTQTNQVYQLIMFYQLSQLLFTIVRLIETWSHKLWLLAQMKTKNLTIDFAK